jgi:hypothetical protein
MNFTFTFKTKHLLQHSNMWLKILYNFYAKNIFAISLHFYSNATVVKFINKFLQMNTKTLSPQTAVKQREKIADAGVQE